MLIDPQIVKHRSTRTFGVCWLCQHPLYSTFLSHMSLSCETFRLEPATRQFVWSFAPMPTSYHRIEHQNGSGPPPVFPPASASAGIVHCLSGSTSITHRSPTAAVLIIHPPRYTRGLLGPCFNTGPSLSASSTFSLFHHLQAYFHISLAVLIRYRSCRYI